MQLHSGRIVDPGISGGATSPKTAYDVSPTGWSGDSNSGFTSHPALHLNGALWAAKAQ
jgi:hypothetical protein